MNKIIKLIQIYFFAFVVNSNAQSGTFSAVQTTGGGTTSNIRPRIALNKNSNPVLVWNKTSNKSVSSSVWNGTSFATPVTLTPMGVQADVFDWAGQEVAAIKDTVYVVYASLNGSVSNVFIQKSINGGISFSDTTRVSNIGTDKARFPTVMINGNGQPAVAFMRMMNSWAMPHYVVSNSMNGGVSFMPDVDASESVTGNDVCDCCPAAIVCNGSKQAMLFRDNDANARNIKAVFSYNNGASFDISCTPDLNNWVLMACPSSGPDGHFGTDSLYSVFATGAVSPMQVFVSASHPTSLQLGSHKVISVQTEQQNYPRIAGSKDTIGIVWEQNNKVMFTYSFSGIAGLSNQLQVNATGDNASNPDIEFANGIFHIVWQSNSGMVHYRTYTIAGTVGIQEKDRNDLRIFPNPSSTFWEIESENRLPFSKMSLVNILGQPIFTKALIPDTILNETISNHILPAGEYFLLLENKYQTFSYKLIKQN